ncbi:hypothetical protein HB762_26645 (plasmid) [Vibrio campbellii]|uniref:Uncharacterized protein n=1 Tax=Vibrio campbellii TaxID=680 RepID=A0ABY5IPB3_9VIBR|nr:hypothetical protein [Vibrio campbellii]UTZ34842.1 hypothetical protein HB762_26645 [Vibrio campbellii]
MIGVHALGKNAELVIGENERAILNAATDTIEMPSNTNVGAILIAIEKVTDLKFGYETLGLTQIEFAKHKYNLLQEMDAAIKAALD